MAKLTHDCIEQVCYQMNDDIRALHSCILLNRTWCLMAIDFLWREPFVNMNARSLKKIIDTYSLFLPLEQRKSPLFIYPSYLRQVNIIFFHKAIKTWVEDNKKKESIYRIVKEFADIIILYSNRLTSLVIDDLNEGYSGEGNLALFQQVIQSNIILENIRKLHIKTKCGCLRHLLPRSEVLEQITVAHLWYKEDSKALGELLLRQKKLKILTIHLSSDFQSFISSLNGKEVPGLTILNLDDIDFWNTSITCLNHFPNLEYLQFEKCQDLMIEINPQVPICRHLVCLLLSETLISLPALGYLLQHASKLYSFQYRGVNIPARDLDIILDLLTNCHSLKILEINIRKENIYTLVNALRTWTQLEELKLWYPDNFSNQAPLDVEKYLENLGFAIPSTLNSLNLQANWAFSPKCLENFFKAVNMKLNYLYIGMCDIRFSHIAVILEFLSKRRRHGKQIKIDFPKSCDRANNI